MGKLKTPIKFETLAGIYSVDMILGEGGAGIVFGGVNPRGEPIALKLLSLERATSDKRSRFQNEVNFLSLNKHANIVTVLDHGVSQAGSHLGPFYVMAKYQGSLREKMLAGIPTASIMGLFSQMLDGVEAAHMKNVIHRDLKPENILYNEVSQTIAIADFGIARFTEDIMMSNVKTKLTDRLANFQYAAPEQRAAGGNVDAPADLYALGLILNEMYTGVVPHGTDYQPISSVTKDEAYLDDIVSRLLRQSPADRPQSIGELKSLIQGHRYEAVSRQRLSQLDGTVIRSETIDTPLALEPPRLIGFDWDNGTLTLELDRVVSHDWLVALNNMGSYSAPMYAGPQNYTFRGKEAFISAQEHDVQSYIDHFKAWLPKATDTLKRSLEMHASQKQYQEQQKLELQKIAEQKRQRLFSQIKI